MSAAGAARILVVDDEPQIVRGLRIILRTAGYAVESAETKAQAMAALASRPPDAVVLDLVLPDGSGVEVCREVRRFSRLPILVLSAVGDEREKVRALDAGADDYITKPFGMDELLARIRVAVRRSAAIADGSSTGAGDGVVETADFSVDLGARRVMRNGAAVRLTPTEWELLELLIRHAGKLVPQRTLLERVWGPGYENETHYLRVYVAQLRRKLEPDPAKPRYLFTEAGMGYRFEVPTAT